MSRAFNHKMHHKTFQKGKLVLAFLIKMKIFKPARKAFMLLKRQIKEKFITMST